MGFKSNTAVKINRSNIQRNVRPAEGYLVYRDKDKGTATVDIWDDSISVQKAGSLVQGMFPVKVKFSHKEQDGPLVRRHYTAEGWL